MKHLLFRISCVLIMVACTMGVQAQTVLTGTVTGNTTVTLLEDECYILRDSFVIESGSALNVEEGVTVLAESGAILVIEPGAIGNFTGTANKPIVFTSDQGSSSAPGDWAGIILAGDAPTNDGAIPLPHTTATAGGSNPTHGLININYLKIDFAGAPDVLGQEYAISFLALGTGCEISNVLVVNAAGSGFLLRGGAPEVKNLMNVNSGVHGYHFTSGNTSKVQNIADIRTDASIAFPSGAASFLVWNNNNPPNYGNLNPTDPYTDPLISNYTALHPAFCNEMAANSLDGIRFAQNGRAKFRNGVIGGVGSGSAGVFIDEEQCIALTASGDIIVDYTDFLGNATNADYDFITDDWFSVPGCSDDVQQWIGESSGGDPGCAMTNNRFETSLPDYDESICFICPLEDPIEFIISIGAPNIEDAVFTWVSMGDLFFDQALEFRGAFQDEDTIYNWVNPCPEACPEQKSTGTENIGSMEQHIRAYPNPVQHELTIRVSGYEGALTTIVVDLFGRKVSESIISGNGTTALPFVQLPAGAYFVQVLHNGSVVQVIKIAKY